jgi:gamma-glutamyltranspeptidase/glutathione hydrolase
MVAPSASVLPEPPVALAPGGARAVSGEHGLVVSVEAHATRVGVRLLERGGNAVDAAVGVAYALAVTHPSAGNLGGGGFALVRMRGQPTVAVDFRERAPAGMTEAVLEAALQTKAVGPRAVGVPVTVAGLDLAHARFGHLPLPDVLAPAIELARQGHRVLDREALTIRWAWPWLAKDPASRAEFGDRGLPRKSGSWLRRPELAITLDRIARAGDQGFYQGETARAIVRALGDRSPITEVDLANYRAVVREPLAFEYRGLRVETAPPPSAGGVALAETLLTLERLGAHRWPAHSPEELHYFLEVTRRAQAERRFNVVDPDSFGESQGAQRRARAVDPDTLLGLGPPIDPKVATPSIALPSPYMAATTEPEHTTHLSVVDAQGNAVSLTTTLSAGFGAKLTARGTGVVLNNSLAAFARVGENQPAPGRRPTSSMAPTLVLRDGDPVLVLGTPGGDTIPSTIAQVLRHLVDHGMTIDQAVDAPRIHHCFMPDEFRYESSHPLPIGVLEALRKLGHTPSRKRIPMGDANVILIAGETAWGYADPREGGLALAATR